MQYKFIVNEAKFYLFVIDIGQIQHLISNIFNKP